MGRFSRSLQGLPLSLCLKEVGPPGLVSDTLAWPASQQTWDSKASSDLEEMRTTEIGNCIAAPHLSLKTSFRGRRASLQVQLDSLPLASGPQSRDPSLPLWGNPSIARSSQGLHEGPAELAKEQGLGTREKTRGPSPTSSYPYPSRTAFIQACPSAPLGVTMATEPTGSQ